MLIEKNQNYFVIMSRVYQCIDKEVNKFNYILENKFNNRYKESN